MNEPRVFYPRVFVISGPSGVGKSTLIHQMIDQVDHMCLSTSVTSRKARQGETDGRDYYFVDKNSFLRMIDQGDFIEWAHLYNNLYGTSRSEIDYILYNRKMHVLLDMDHQGMSQVTSRFSGVISIFVAPPDFEELERRLRKRGTESGDALEIRILSARQEMVHKEEYDHVVVNHSVEQAVSDLVALIAAEEKHQMPFLLKREEHGVSMLDRAVLYALEMLEDNHILMQLNLGVREAVTHDVLLQIRKKLAEGFEHVRLEHIVQEVYTQAKAAEGLGG